MQAISPCFFSDSAGNAVAVVAPGRAWAIDCQRRGVWHGSLAEVVWHAVWLRRGVWHVVWRSLDQQPKVIRSGPNFVLAPLLT